MPHALLDQRAHLVLRERHAVEVCEDVLALHLLADELELSEALVILAEVAQVDLEHAALQGIRRDLCKPQPRHARPQDN